MQIDDSGLGDNGIGKILKDADVWAITFTYKDGGDSTTPENKVYPLIKHFIDTHNTPNDNIINALNQSKLGVAVKKIIAVIQAIIIELHLAIIKLLPLSRLKKEEILIFILTQICLKIPIVLILNHIPLR